MTNKLQLFQGTTIRTVWDSEKEEWFFSVVDVCNVLSGSQAKDPGTYWRKLKQRLKAEGSEIVTNCHGLKLQAADDHPQIKINIDSLSRCFFCVRSIHRAKNPTFICVYHFFVVILHAKLLKQKIDREEHVFMKKL